MFVYDKHSGQRLGAYCPINDTATHFGYVTISCFTDFAFSMARRDQSVLVAAALAPSAGQRLDTRKAA